MEIRSGSISNPHALRKAGFAAGGSLGEAISRETAAGVPRSAIRIGASSSLASGLNPAGLGVYNTIDEPGGLNQGINMHRASGLDPKKAGIPNFAGFSGPVLGPGGMSGRTAAGMAELGRSKASSGLTDDVIDDFLDTTKDATTGMQKWQSRALQASFIFPMVSGQLQSMVGTGTKASKYMESFSNGIGVASSFFAIGGPWGAGVGAAVGAFTMIDGALTTASSNILELSKKADESKEQLTKAGNALSAYGDGLQRYQEALRTGDAELTVRLQKNLNKQLAEVPTAFRQQVLAAKDATDLQNKVADSLKEMAKQNAQTQFAASLEKTVTGERTGFANSAMRGGIASIFGKETFDIDVFEEIPGAAKKFASELRSTLDFDKLSKDLKDIDFEFGNKENFIGRLQAAGAGSEVTKGIEDLSADDINKLKNAVEGLSREHQLASEQVDKHKEVTEKYADAIEKAARTVKILEERFKTFIVNGRKAAEMLDDQITANDKLREKRTKFRRGDALGDAQRSLATRKPFMTEENIAVSEARIGRRKRLDDRNASMMDVDIENQSQKRDVIIDLRAALMKELEAKAVRAGGKKDAEGKLVPAMTPQEEAGVSAFLRASSQALVSGQINTATPGQLSSLLPGDMRSGLRAEMGGAVAGANLDILKANQTSNQKLDTIAEEQRQSRITEEKQLQAQLEQISIQKDIAGAGGMEGFASGQGLDQALDKFSTGMVGMIAGRKRGSLSIAGRGAAMVEGSIQDVTGRPSGNMKLRNLAAAGRAENLNWGMGLMRGGLGAMGLGANGLGRGAANRMAQNQADAFFKTGKPITPIGDKYDSKFSAKLQQHSLKSAVTREAYLKNILTVLSDPRPILDATQRAKEEEDAIKASKSDELKLVLKAIENAFTKSGNQIQSRKDYESLQNQQGFWNNFSFVPSWNTTPDWSHNANGYLPNFAGGRRGEKRSVMDSSQYSPTEKSRAIPNRKMVNGQMTYTNHLEKVKNNYGGSGQSAVLTPRMMRSGFANGHIPNFAKTPQAIIDAAGIMDSTVQYVTPSEGVRDFPKAQRNLMEALHKDGFYIVGMDDPDKYWKGDLGKAASERRTHRGPVPVQTMTGFGELRERGSMGPHAKPVGSGVSQRFAQQYHALTGSYPDKEWATVLDQIFQQGHGQEEIDKLLEHMQKKEYGHFANSEYKKRVAAATEVAAAKKASHRILPATAAELAREIAPAGGLPEILTKEQLATYGDPKSPLYNPEYLEKMRAHARHTAEASKAKAAAEDLSKLKVKIPDGAPKPPTIRSSSNRSHSDFKGDTGARHPWKTVPDTPDTPKGVPANPKIWNPKRWLPGETRDQFLKELQAKKDAKLKIKDAKAEAKRVERSNKSLAKNLEKPEVGKHSPGLDKRTGGLRVGDYAGGTSGGGTLPGAKPSIISPLIEKGAKGLGKLGVWAGEAGTIGESHRYLNPNVWGGGAPSGFSPGDIAKGRVPSGGPAGHRVSALGNPSLQGGTGAGYNRSLKGLKGVGMAAKFGLKWLSGAGEVMFAYDAATSSGTYAEYLQDMYGISIGEKGGLTGRMFDIEGIKGLLGLSHNTYAEEENELFNKSLMLKSEKISQSYTDHLTKPAKNMNAVLPLQDKQSLSERGALKGHLRNKEDRDFFNEYNKKLIRTRKAQDETEAWKSAGFLEKTWGTVKRPSQRKNRDQYFLYGNERNRKRYARIKWQLNNPNKPVPEDMVDPVMRSRDSSDNSQKLKQAAIASQAKHKKELEKLEWAAANGIKTWKLTSAEMDMSQSSLKKKLDSGTLGYMAEEERNRIPSHQEWLKWGPDGKPKDEFDSGVHNKPNYPKDTPQAYQGFGLEGGPKDIKEQGKAELIKKIGADAYAKNFNEDGSPKAWSPEPIDKKTLARNQKAALKLAKERRRYGGLTKAEWERLPELERRLRSGRSNFANGYIPNFASLTPDYSQFSWMNNDNFRNPYDRNFMMSTPGLRGLLNPNQSFGRTFANGLIPSLRSSQRRERMQSGRNDVYSRYVDTPKYSGMATFNGSERGREEAIVRNHPNPKNAGATPNFASGTEAVGKLEKVMANLNIQIASLSEKMAQVQSTGEGAQGQAQVSMSPLNVNVNHSGRLTAQVEEIQSQISGAVNEAMKQIAPALWRTIKGPATS
jgi:hypothetical protein